MNQRGVAQVVQAVVVEDLCASLEPDGLLELDAGVLGQQLGGEDAQSAEQCPPGVDDLDLAIPVVASGGHVALISDLIFQPAERYVAHTAATRSAAPLTI